MDFSFTPIQIRAKSLNMDYFFVPWDTEIIGRPVAEINRFEVIDFEEAKIQFACFEEWREQKKIELCSCRIDHDSLTESFFLQEHDFRFIELNYHPEYNGLQKQKFSSDTIEIAIAKEGDKETLAQMAAHTFKHGRFHQDISLGPVIGNERYKTWLINSFSHPTQFVYKCMIDGEIVGFFVTEYSANKNCNWVLVGLAPGLQGRGIGTRVWKAMMNFHQSEGMESITTSISSHNTAVLNLYVKLGFRYPRPQVTFHWRR
jgi:RimJ/RimL family protein N-acetyltransferase